MRCFSFLWCLLAGCSLQTNKPLKEYHPVVRELSESKQKQKIASLQKKLQNAEMQQLQAELWVVQLKKEIQTAQLALIRKQVDRYELKFETSQGYVSKDHFFEDKESLFMKEREDLYALIQSDANPDAVALLDRILRLITELSDDQDKSVRKI